jgi:hypothetical protein
VEDGRTDELPPLRGLGPPVFLSYSFRDVEVAETSVKSSWVAREFGWAIEPGDEKPRVVLPIGVGDIGVPEAVADWAHLASPAHCAAAQGQAAVLQFFLPADHFDDSGVLSLTIGTDAPAGEVTVTDWLTIGLPQVAAARMPRHVSEVAEVVERTGWSIRDYRRTGRH